MKNKRLLEALNLVDEKYIKEAEPKMKKSPIKAIIGVAACLVLFTVAGLYLFLPFKEPVKDLSEYESSEYYPIIEKIEAYSYRPLEHKNNFEYILYKIDRFFGNIGGFLAKGDVDNMSGDAAPPTSAPENGEYVEVTDNQTAGVIEADIVKRTDRYIFHLTPYGQLKVYTINGADSETAAEYTIPRFDDEYSSYKHGAGEMYLSADGGTVTVLKKYVSTDNKTGAVGIIQLDVSDLNNITVKGTFTIEGDYNSSRMVDGKLLLITEFYFSTGNADYARPETYVPEINYGEGKRCVEFEDIIFPDKIGNTRYSVVALLDADDLSMLGTSALLSFTDEVYVSAENIFITRGYASKTALGDNKYKTETMTDTAILGYKGGALEKRGVISFRGSIKDKWSLDEHEGYLRVVTTTSSETYEEERTANNVSVSIGADGLKISAALYIFDLKDNSLKASVEDFAPVGETAESVRFDGDTAYVCTAVVVTLTDPVFFFDLSDYDNITYTDTGVIDGFSSSLINFKDGFLLGIGMLDREYNKVEVYESQGDGVESVDVYLFSGIYSTDYKSYLVDREDSLFGFSAAHVYDEQMNKPRNYYILLNFDGYKLTELARVEVERLPDELRGIYIDGWLYIVGEENIKAVRIG